MLMRYQLRSEILRKSSYQSTSVGTQILVPQKEKNTFLYTNMLYHRPCFFLLKQIKVNFQLGKHTLSIANHFKAWKIHSLYGFYPIDGHQHFNLKLLGAIHFLQNQLLCG